MDRNFVLAMALSFLVLSLWMYWQGDLQRQQPQVSPGENIAGTEPGAAPSPWDSPQPQTPVPELRGPRSEPVLTPTEAEERVRISLPLYEAEFTTRGGALLGWKLEKFFDEQGKAIELATLDPEREVALATPFVDLDQGDLSQAPFTLERPDELTLRFSRSQQGITLTKTYRLDPESYAMRLEIVLINESTRDLAPAFAVIWPVTAREGTDFSEQALVALHAGSIEKTAVGSIGSPGFFGGLFGGGATEMQSFEGDVDWAGATNRYFLAAVVPAVSRDARVRFVPQERGKSGLTVIEPRPETIPSGHRAAHEFVVYIGPKEAKRLVAQGASLDRAIDYGYSWVSPLTHFFTWLMRAAHEWIPNYGIVIILITLVVRVVTAPLTAKQMRSMKRLSKLQPKMKELQDKYADDRARLQQEMMAMYKREGMNPLTAMGGGCMPLLLQFPVFIGLFFALQNAIELRRASFGLWIDDLSAPETLFMIPGLELPVRLLPILMGASMILQQKLSPQTMDPAQARMMTTIMPVVFTALFYQFPSGLVLYWLVSNLMAIAHQMWMNRGAEPAPA